jgi:hypothetical protein
LTIDRIDLRVAVAARPRDAQHLSGRITRTAEDELARACAQALGSLGGGDAVIRIRELTLELALDADSVTRGALSGEWGRLLADAVRDTLASSRGVVRFDTPLDYLAAFLRDLADGSAWGRWHWDELRALAGVRPGAAAATLLSARPDWIEAVLERLGATAERLIGRLDEEDVGRLWAALGLPPAPALPDPRSAAWAAVELVWPRLRLERDAGADARARNALRAWRELAAERRRERVDGTAAALILALVELWALVRREPAARALVGGRGPLDVAAIERVAGPDALGWIAPAAADGRLDRAAGIVDDDRSTVTGPRAAPASPFGSVLLITPALAELGVWELWLDELGEDAARRNIFATVLKALGRESAPLALGDELLATLAGLPHAPTADGRLPVEPEPSLAWREALAGLMRPRELVLARVPHINVLRDRARAVWIAAWPDGGEPPGRLLGGRSASAAGARDLETLAAEAAHVQLGRRIGFPWLTPGLDAALSAVASMVLRATARRIPGFANAGPGHLARQFLAQPGTLAREGGELVAELGGGRLAAVLRMADLPESQPLPWAGVSLRCELGSAGL